MRKGVESMIPPLGSGRLSFIARSGGHRVSTTTSDGPLLGSGSLLRVGPQGSDQLSRSRRPEVGADLLCQTFGTVEDTAPNGDLHTGAGTDVANGIDEDPDVGRVDCR